MIEKTSPLGYTQIKPMNMTIMTERLDISDGFFLAGFQLIDWDMKALNLTDLFYPIFEYKVFKYNKETGETLGESVELDTITCDKFKTGKHGKLYSPHHILDGFYCPDLSKLDDTQRLFGDFNSDSLSYVSFRLALCDRHKTECKDLKKVRDYFDKNEVFISAIYPKISYFIDESDPFEKVLHNHYTYLNNDAFLLEEFTLQK